MPGLEPAADYGRQTSSGLGCHFLSLPGQVDVHIKAPRLDWLTSLDLEDLGNVGRHLVELTAGTL